MISNFCVLRTIDDGDDDEDDDDDDDLCGSDEDEVADLEENSYDDSMKSITVTTVQ
jgi:hypothetical protein